MKKYVCLSCGAKIKNEKHMGYCPICNRNSLKETIIINCPICNRTLEENNVDINTIGWNCPKCKIKIYMEKE